MLSFKKYLAVLLLLTAIQAFAKSPLTITSPDKKIAFSLNADKAGLYYKITYKGIVLAENSRLNISFKNGGAFASDVTFKAVHTEKLTEDYELITGRASKIHSECNRAIIPVREQSGIKRMLYVEVRIFNDGVAFRYVMPKQASMDKVEITEEANTFNLLHNPKATVLLRDNFVSSHEGIYTKSSLNKLAADTLMDMPALFEFPQRVYMAITEAALHDYAGMYLMKHNGVLESRLSPLPKEPGVAVRATLPHNSPWRVMQISERVGTFLESNILTNLNEPSKIKGLSWLKPGKTTFPWWNGNVTPDSLNAPGNNYVTNMYYVDFCAKNKIQYHSVVEYGLHEWYVNDGSGFQPGPNADPSRAVPGLDMQQVCDSAGARGVGIRVWVHFYALYPKLEQTFAQYEKWGIKGLMCDFMDRDDQEMVNMQEEVLQCAAKHKLHIQFHGAYKPTGMQRTYPNEFTREGTLNYENDKWGNLVTPDTDLDILFTRLLAGSTDYHLGGFRAATPQNFKVNYTRPMVLGTRCHMLAMYVALENPLGMACDYPDAYAGQPGFDFIQQVPTTWDETRVLDAQTSQYLTIARRKGSEWYIGAITNSKPRDLKTKLDFLPAGNYTAEIWSDAPDANVNANHLVKEVKLVTKETLLSTVMASGGGQVVRIYKGK